jgi:hypothetical protein
MVENVDFASNGSGDPIAAAFQQKDNLDPFANLDALRLSQDFGTDACVKKLLTTVPVRRPGNQHFFRVHPSEAWQLSPAAIIELKDDREVYLVHPAIVPEIPGEHVAASIVTTITRQGTVALWPLKLPTPDGRRNDWHRSALEAAETAMSRWVRVRANLQLGAYDIFASEAVIADPVWPDVPFPELIKIAFRDRLIDSVDHPVLKSLRGA